MRLIALLGAIGLLASSTNTVRAIDLQDCTSIKNLKKHLACTDDNIAKVNAALNTTNGSLSNYVVKNKDFKLGTRGWCISWIDENQAPRMMTCDHPDLQGWRIN